MAFRFGQYSIVHGALYMCKERHDNGVQRHLFIKRAITSNRSTITKWFYVSKFFDSARCMTEEAEVRSGLKNKDRQNRTPDFGRPVLVRKGKSKKVMDLVACILAENKNLKRIYVSGFFAKEQHNGA